MVAIVVNAPEPSPRSTVRPSAVVALHTTRSWRPSLLKSPAAIACGPTPADEAIPGPAQGTELFGWNTAKFDCGDPAAPRNIPPAKKAGPSTARAVTDPSSIAGLS